MNYYSHHIGDFDRATRHLTRLERSVYRDLLDVYYDTEQPLTLDVAALCRKIIARTNEESTAVEQVLNEFFTKTPTGWYHERCEEELDAYRTSTSQKSIAGKASAAKRALKRQQALNGIPTSVEQTINDTPTNQEPRTNNHKPVKTKETQSSIAPCDWIPQSAWSGYMEMRKKKRKEPTARAVELLVAELEKLKALGHDIAAVLDKSTLNGWTDVYPIKPEQNARGSPGYTSNKDASRAAAAASIGLGGSYGNDTRTIDAQCTFLPD